MRILLINNLFHPEPNHIKGLAFAKELQERGHAVHVLTGFPNYPGGRVYPGYRIRWTCAEELEGVPITRVAMYPSHDGSGLKRAASYASVALSQAVHTLSLKKRFDLCHVYLGPITLMWPAMLVRSVTGAKIVADVQDIWPESVTDSEMLRSHVAAGLLARWSRWSYGQADRLLVLSPGYKRALAARGIPERKIDVVYNWCEESSLAEVCEDAVRDVLTPGAFNIVYAGNLGKHQGMDTILEAAKKVASAAPRVAFTLVGDGVEAGRLARRVADERIENVTMTGRLPLARVNAIQRKADLLVIHVEPSPLTRIGIPSKIQGCLACGTPVLLAAEGDSADLLARSGGGLTCRPGDPDALAAAIGRVLAMSDDERDQLGARGRDFYRSDLSFRHGVDRVERSFQGALAGSG